MKATTRDAYELLHHGSLALSQVEANGICIDTEYLDNAIEEVAETIKTKTKELKKQDIYKQWKKRYGTKLTLESGAQLGKVLFTDMDYKCKLYTKGKKPVPKTDVEALETLGIPFVDEYIAIKRLKKARQTYLLGIKRETCNGFLHPVFNLHIADTYRSSSDSPNFQNMPVRDPAMAKLIRQCFIPRLPTNHIVELDYGGIEVHAAAWYHKDPVMLEYIHDETKDMHRDMAQECYKLKANEMVPQNKKDGKRIKMIRYCGKNKFVFPEFYGDWWMSCAPALWQAMEQMKLKMRDGTSIKKHLRKKGIKKLGVADPKVDHSNDFMGHIQKVEKDFWGRRFKVYNDWKDEWRESFYEKGSFQTLTGFVIDGAHLNRNQVINYPIQGVAFHCLLWSLTRLQKLLRKYKMKTLIIGQIHDSIVADVPSNELEDYLALANKVMTVDIKKHWGWIITPLEIEAEVAPMGRSWYEKADYKIN